MAMSEIFRNVIFEQGNVTMDMIRYQPVRHANETTLLFDYFCLLSHVI